VYGIVNSHGGTITCDSGVGTGTTFKMYLPATEPEDQSETPDDFVAEPLRGGVETILLVDDEEPIRNMASQALMSYRYTVLTASSGEEALNVYASRKNEIDLIVMDLGMPGMGGHRCLKELIRIDPEVKVLIASGYSSEGLGRKTLEAGAAGYVGKPYQLKDLLRAVRAILDGTPAEKHTS
jgi:CheY-like chemotaxis protein